MDDVVDGQTDGDIQGEPGGVCGQTQGWHQEGPGVQGQLPGNVCLHRGRPTGL